ncbi:hypothetical protein SNOG_06890 [Parastagonospora nodorum SN15]|uniref:Chitin-binding type-4 domain-containing protein n=1 Tax=Phaeosphaeria nodorum (strain SN15 / ATCC MYA-4574 / FGSC 10173) TaxID=321614 RepID=Q0UMX4_PHANO|nr:hypothetical protein SNOG_06890 [Parastagonospora nodorum SN15]EAT85541.2 hypothetical protein SNOG_06890 [Parastagonospora nodorum SN15]
MVFSTTTILGAMLAIAPLAAHAHIIMASPVPFGPTGSFPKQDPLKAADFPCQNAPSTGATVNNVGCRGGSCQVSVTKDKSPTKDSVWKVIHSWEGGCPDVPPGGGNWSPADAKAVRPPLPFTIPTELPNGEMSMAWTWSNKVGNREFYMNCAAVEISGGAKDDTAFDALPDMAVNIEWFTPGGAPVAWWQRSRSARQPRHSFSRPSPPNPVFPSPVAPINSMASGSMGAPAASVSPAPSAASGAQTSTLRTIITVTAPQGASPTGMAPVSPPASGAAPPSAPASPSQAPGAPASACSPDGAVICSPDGKQFALCNHGKAIFQAVAGGDYLLRWQDCSAPGPFYHADCVRLDGCVGEISLI